LARRLLPQYHFFVTLEAMMKAPLKRLPLPEWFKIRPPSTTHFAEIKSQLRTQNLKTVCEEAHCPNLTECWSGGTATIMLLGDTCTRGCRFCAVNTGNPHGELDQFEPWVLAQTVKRMSKDSHLDYIVLTMVARDDLPDGGAGHIAKCIRAIHQIAPEILVEILVSDLRGSTSALETILESGVVVLAHNIETIERLTKFVRDGRARYRQSLEVFKNAKKIASQKRSLYTKSSIMLGLGETEEEVIAVMLDLRDAGVDMLTLGQYLQPSSQHIPVKEYIHPSQFAHLETLALDLGFLAVSAGPLVRSSYKAGELFIKAQLRPRGQPWQ